MRTRQPPAANSTAASAAGLGRTALGSATGQRLPVAPRERKPALAALAVLLILGGALTSGYLVMASGNRVSAIQVRQPVAAGQPITLDALREAQVGDTGVPYIRWSERFKVAQAYAAVPLVPGALLINEMTTQPGDPRLGRLVVGLALKPGQFPAGELQNGRHVGLYAAGGQSGSGVRAGALLSGDAIVVGISRPGQDTLRSDQLIISVAVPADQVPQLTQAAAASAVAVALLPAGSTAPAAGTQPARPDRGTASGQPSGQQGAGQQGAGQQGTGQQGAGGPSGTAKPNGGG